MYTESLPKWNTKYGKYWTYKDKSEWKIKVAPSKKLMLEILPCLSYFFVLDYQHWCLRHKFNLK